MAVEAIKWCTVLAIALWLTIAQLAAWRRARDIDDYVAVLRARHLAAGDGGGEHGHC